MGDINAWLETSFNLSSPTLPYILATSEYSELSINTYITNLLDVMTILAVFLEPSHQYPETEVLSYLGGGNTRTYYHDGVITLTRPGSIGEISYAFHPRLDIRLTTRPAETAKRSRTASKCATEQCVESTPYLNTYTWHEAGDASAMVDDRLEKFLEYVQSHMGWRDPREGSLKNRFTRPEAGLAAVYKSVLRSGKELLTTQGWEGWTIGKANASIIP
jgi:hypothetical protein